MLKSVTLGDFRTRAGKIRKDLEAQTDLLLTANGRPFALISRVEPESVEDEVRALRRVRAIVAVERMQAKAKAAGLDKMTMAEIDEFIAEVRRKRRTGK